MKKNDKVTVHGDLVRPLSPAELDVWHRSPASQGIGEDGETKLPPRGAWRRSDGSETFVVVRARVVNRVGWREVPKSILLRDGRGLEWYARRVQVEPVS